ncbi:MAG: TlpA disulfide reductase family protein [Pseudomonadota bacterium]
MNRWVLYALVAVLGLGLGAGVAWFTLPGPPAPGIEGAQEGDPRPEFRHAAVDGQFVSASDFDGQAMLVNFWATWCAPCRREMPLLNEISQSHAGRMTVVGIAIDEPGPVVEFVNELGIDYPILVGTSDVMATQQAWGNASGALPYTVLVDASGVIRWRHLGEVTVDQLQPVLDQWVNP